MKKYDVTNGCTYCGTCMWECPVEAITINADGAHIDQEACIGCGACAANCASEAITEVKAEDKTVNK